MPHKLGLSDEDYVFGDIRGVIGKALDVAQEGHQVRGWLDHYRIGFHRVYEIVEDLTIEFIDNIFFLENGARLIAVAVNECVQDGCEHFACSGDHFCRSNLLDQMRIIFERLYTLCDIDCDVADSFKIAVHTHSREQQPEIDSYGLS